MEIEVFPSEPSIRVADCRISCVYAGLMADIGVQHRGIFLRTEGGMVNLHTGEFFSVWKYSVLFRFRPVRAKLHVAYVCEGLTRG